MVERMADRCPTDVKYEFHGMDMDIYKDFSPSEEYKMTEYQHGYQDGFQAGVIYERSQAEPKSGRWVVLEGKLGGYAVLHCKKCGTTFNYVPSWEYHYCPNCGADMRGGKDES